MKISIIIPVYNCEKYLEECLESIIHQVDKNMDEIIIINDGSTDSSDTIISRFLSVYSNIIYILTENKGVSNARNIGINTASGDFVLFIDSDDILIDGTIKKIKKECSFDVDCIFTKYRLLGDNTIKADSYVKKDLNKKEALNYMYYGKNICGYVWNKVYRKDFLLNNGIRFSLDSCILEDELFNLCVIHFANKIVYYDFTSYLYRVHYDSLSHEHSVKKYLSLVKTREKIFKLINYNMNEKKFIKKTHRLFLLAIFDSYKYRLNYEDKKNIRELYLKYKKNYYYFDFYYLIKKTNYLLRGDDFNGKK